MINRLSFLFDKPKRSYNEIGTLNLMILNNSIKQRYLYRFSIASSSYFVNRGCVHCSGGVDGSGIMRKGFLTVCALIIIKLNHCLMLV